MMLPEWFHKLTGTPYLRWIIGPVVVLSFLVFLMFRSTSINRKRNKTLGKLRQAEQTFARERLTLLANQKSEDTSARLKYENTLKNIEAEQKKLDEAADLGSAELAGLINTAFGKKK